MFSIKKFKQNFKFTIYKFFGNILLELVVRFFESLTRKLQRISDFYSMPVKFLPKSDSDWITTIDI